MKTFPETNRSNMFVGSFQIEGLCDSIRLLVSHGIDPGQSTRKILSDLRDAFLANTSGFAFSLIPKVTEDMQPAELLVIAEVLRTTMLAFLTPEEAEERGSFGFNAPSRPVN